MAINVGTLALSISVNEQEVLNKLRRVDAAAAKVGTGRLAAEREMAREATRNAVAMHLAAEKNKTKITLAEIRTRHALELAQLKKTAAAQAAGSIRAPSLSMIGLSATVIGAATARGVVSAANDYQLLQQRLAQVTDSASEARVAFNLLQQASMQLRVPTADLTELFVKLRQSNSALGYNMGQTAAMTRAFSAALRISGATGQAASSALLQFGQAMAKGRLDGDEFRTVAENASEVLRVLERYLNETGKGAELFGKKTAITRGEILKLREEGKLSSKVLGDALLWDLKNLERQASRLPPTLDQAGTSFRNNVLKMIGASNDLQTSMQNIANSIVRLGNFLSANGNVIIGLVTLATKAALATMAVKGLHSILSLFLNLTPVGRILTAIATAALGMSVYFDLASARANDLFNQERERRLTLMRDKIDAIAFAADDAAKKLALMALNEDLMAKAVRQRDLEMQARQLEGEIADRERRMVGATLVEKNAPRNQEQKKRLAELKREIALLGAEAMDAGKQVQFLMRGGATATAGGAGGDPVKDTTDKFLQQAKVLAESNALRQQEFERLNKLLIASRDIIDKNTASTEVLALARSREAQIMEILNLHYGDNVMLSENTVDNRLKEIVSLAELGVLTKDQLQFVTELNAAEREKIATGTLSEEQMKRSLTLYRESNKALEEQRKKINALIVAMGALSGAGTGATVKPEVTPMDRLKGLLDRQLFRQLALAPGQLVSEFFASIGQKVEEGGESVSEKMRKALGDIFSNVGRNVIQQGFMELMPSFKDIWKLISKGLGWVLGKMGTITGVFGKIFTSLQSLMTNPLTAGPAMIALGAAMVAFGAALGGVVGGGAGGNFGGGIGGLGIGGGRGTMSAVGPIPNTFTGNTQSPTQGMGGAPAGVQPVVVNATIIGPNDPSAQRQIATLIDNAARRGLMQGGGMRV